MPTESLSFSLISLIFLSLYSYPYVRGILSWKTIPHPFTFWVFFILTLINTYILYKQAYFYSLIPLAAELVLFLIYVYFGIKNFKKIKNTSWFDIICLILSIGCICILFLIGDIEAVIATILVDTIALMPTLKKIYYQPHTEIAIMWAGSACFFLFLLLTIDTYTWENTLFWIYLFFADALTALYIFLSQKLKKS